MIGSQIATRVIILVEWLLFWVVSELYRASYNRIAGISDIGWSCVHAYSSKR